MALITKKIKGTEDVLPKQSYRWQFVENIMREESRAYGFREMRTPVFEHTELFARGVGQTTDVVQKEMYTFDTKGGESVTLRPEGTAGAARAVLEHALENEGLPIKASYFVSCYRYEKPQAGRLREFHQFGVEEFGTQSPVADAELICLAQSVLDRLGLTGVHLELNSIGCPACRAKYNEALRAYFGQYKEQLCTTCLSRLEKNPMRLLDCKSPEDHKIAEGAPKITDYLCEECEAHFAEVQRYLTGAGVAYTVNPTIVRGLDYYTKTVFEFVTDCIIRRLDRGAGRQAPALSRLCDGLGAHSDGDGRAGDRDPAAGAVRTLYRHHGRRRQGQGVLAAASGARMRSFRRDRRGRQRAASADEIRRQARRAVLDGARRQRD